MGRRGKTRKKRKKKDRKRGRSAAAADRHELYELAVQEPLADCELLDQAWKDIRGRLPKSIREDFCGTAIMSIEWVKYRPGNTAVGIDLDEEVLAIGEQRIRKRLAPADRKRIKLLHEDVLKAKTPKVDSVLALNFSHFIFKTRRKLKQYYKRAYDALKDDGLFMLDAYGGSDAFVEDDEDREIDGFTYVWDTNLYNPITGDVIQHIHFRFPDGSALNEAFTYEWRLWTLPELQEVLKEAGFKDVVVYWEGTDEDGEGNGEWASTRRGEACEGWFAYLFAAK
ncbi:MAG: class I SAM-dependent methyltransferase [Planctomycetota bacterium]|nr:class I SAM-dependent methyltransferase [Planctomycetota bacterium]